MIKISIKININKLSKIQDYNLLHKDKLNYLS